MCCKRSSILRAVAVATTWTLTTLRCRPRLVFNSTTTEQDRATTTWLVGQGKLNMNTVKRTDPFEVIAAYKPKVVTEERWSELSGFVLTAVGNTVEDTWTADRTRNALRLVIKLCNFVLRTGRDLSVEASSPTTWCLPSRTTSWPPTPLTSAVPLGLCFARSALPTTRTLTHRVFAPSTAPTPARLRTPRARLRRRESGQTGSVPRNVVGRHTCCWR